MKKVFIIVSLFVASIMITKAQDSLDNRKITTIPLKDALKKGLIELSIAGAYNPNYIFEIIDKEGVHYGKCMTLYLKSKIDSFIFLQLDCGTLLIPEDDSVQTMITTHNAKFPLYPKSAYATRFYAMCTQFHDRPPMIITPFKIADKADSSLLKLTKHIESSYMQNMVGQHAIWALTDHVKFEDFKKYGADSNSIEKSIELLNAVNIKTSLNESKIKKSESGINLNQYLVFIGSFFILFGVIFWVVVKKK